MRIRKSLGQLGQVAREIANYRTQLNDKIKLFTERVAYYIQMQADSLFGAAVVDIQPNGTYDNANVEVEVRRDGDIYIVIAKGEEAVFVEFGAGVYFNGTGSPRPGGEELSLTIGSYGLGHGMQNAWAFSSADGKVVTRGTPAQMPLYKSMCAARDNILTIAEEVFG